MEFVTKVKSLSETVEYLSDLKKDDKTIGFVTGCFDIIHISHINYFLKSKEFVDVLVVGVDSDLSIKLSKGENRPIFSQKTRCKLLSQLECVDVVLPFKKDIVFGSQDAYKYLLEITKKISPDYLITNTLNDRFWKKIKK